MYGGFGIGKTVSLVLFNYLSCIINKYTFDSFKDQEMNKEYKFLKENYLNWNVPKLFYWSLRFEDDYSQLRQIVLQQASELDQNQKR